MAFTRDWDESNPTDETRAYEIDDYNRYLRVDVSDRLKDMIYGFTAGENDGTQGFKELTFLQQSSAAGTPNADEIVVYSIDDGSACGLYAKNEDGYVKQILKKSGTSLILNVEAGDYAADSIDEDDIELDNDSYLLATDAAGTGTVNLIKAGTNDLCTLPDSAEMASSAAPTEDEGIANKKYVDDQDSTDHPAYSGGESHTDGSGMITKMGYVAIGATSGTITFGSAFPTDVVGLSTTIKNATATLNSVTITDFTTADIDWTVNDAGMTGFYWIAIGY